MNQRNNSSDKPLRFFDLKARGTSLATEINGGATTFLTMSYIIFVQPAVMVCCGMDAEAVMVATCLASALGTLAMGLFTNYPIALAPAMGHNFFFAFTVCGVAMGFSWQVALAANLIAGFIFLVLTLLGFQNMLLNAVSSSLKNAIAVGIGLLIAFLGLQWSGLIVDAKGTLVGLGDFKSPPVVLSLCGLLIISILMALKIRTAFIIGMITMALCGLVVTKFTKIDLVEWQGVVDLSPSLKATFFKVDFLGLKELGLVSAVTVVLVFLFLDIFDTMGTLIGVGEQAGLVKNGKLPKAKGAFLADSVGTISGTLLGTSTVTSYIESSAGVAAGARTCIANFMTAGLFLAAIFFSPLLSMFSKPFIIEGGAKLYPVIAPVLIVVGFLMMKNVSRINWSDFTDGFPCFLAICLMMFTFSITEGIAIGFVATSVLKCVTMRNKEVSPLIHIMSVLFVLRWIFLAG